MRLRGGAAGTSGGLETETSKFGCFVFARMLNSPEFLVSSTGAKRDSVALSFQAQVPDTGKPLMKAARDSQFEARVLWVMLFGVLFR